MNVFSCASSGFCTCSSLSVLLFISFIYREVHQVKLWTAFYVSKGIMNGSKQVELGYGDMEGP